MCGGSKKSAPAPAPAPAPIPVAPGYQTDARGRVTDAVAAANPTPLTTFGSELAGSTQ